MTVPSRIVAWVACIGFIVAGPARAASLILNHGFEMEGPAGQATNWWTYTACGRQGWAARPQSLWGMGFYAAGNAYGGFGQDVPVALAAGDVFTFAISAKAEANYTNPVTTISMEFCTGSTTNTIVSRNVYGELDAERGGWVYLELVHTNTVPTVDLIKVRCDFANSTIPGGTFEGTCQWDDARLFQSRATAPTAPNYAKFEPLRGVYLGVLLERGGTADAINEFNQKAGKPAAVYAKFLIFQQDPFPWDWVNMVKTNCPGAGLHLILEPMVGFTNFYADDWGPGQATHDAALEFATNCAAAGVPVFLRFAHEANGDWYPWHPEFSTRYSIPDTVSNATYIAGYRRFAQLVHSNAPNVAMVWGPNQGNGPYPMPFYEDVYPGDDCVDWVGMSVYNGWSYGNSNEVLDYQFKNAVQKGYWQENDDPYDDTFENFYWTFSDPDNPSGHHKPMMIAETAAAFEPKYDVSNEVLIAGFESLDGPQYTVSNLLCQFQGLNSDGLVASNHTWADGFDDLSTWNWGPWGTNGYTWSTTVARVEGAGALFISGRPEGGGVYLGGNGRTIDSVSFTAVRTLAEFQDLNSDGLEMLNTTAVDGFENLAIWNWGPWGNMFWSNSSDRVQGTNAAHIGGPPPSGQMYVGGNGRTYDPDWSMNNGMQVWARRDSSANVNPILVLGLRSGPGPGSSTATATASRVITSDTYAPQKIFFTEMTVSPGFDWSSIWDFTVELISTAAGQRPGDVYVDDWTRGTVTNATLRDQDWWPAGPTCTPWGDGSDTFGGTHTWTRVSDPVAGMPTNSLQLSGTDCNTNSYIGGNGFATRTEDRDWSAAAHLGLVVRRAVGAQADPMLRVELLDGASKTSAVTLAVGGQTYARQILAITNMATDPGFAWTNVATVKFHMLTGVAGLAPADLFVKQFQIGQASSNQTPSDWSAFDGMEIYVKRETGARPDPVLAVSVRSQAAGLTGTAAVNRAVTHTNYYAIRIPFADMTLTPAFTFTNVTALVIESFTAVSNQEPAGLFVDAWRLVNLDPAPYTDQDWWPPGTNDDPWTDDTDASGGWMEWDLVEDALDGYPAGALRMRGFDANTNYYVGGNGFSLSPEDQDWSSVTFLSLMARRGDLTNAETLLSISLRDSSNVRTARTSVVVVPTNYLQIQVPLADMTANDGFEWTNVAAVVFELLSGTPGVPCSDIYLKGFSVGTASNVTEQDWWMAGTGYQPWGDSRWTQSTDAAAGSYSLRIGGLITNETQWYIGGNGCAMPVPRQDWSSSGALVLYAKKGTVTNYVQPKFKITLDNDYAETNGNEAIVETKVANTNWYEMIIAFEDFISDPGFAWTNIKMVKIELFTGEAGQQPNDLFLDHLQRASITLTNGDDNIKWKRDWCNQLFALEDYSDGDPADPDPNPDYVDVSRVFRNIHMINWFHVKKFEDGFTKDLKIAEDGTGGVVYESYHQRVQEPYFLTNIIRDADFDGMTDEWESEHFNGPTNADAGADADVDGYSNWQEYLAGSDPTNKLAVFHLGEGGPADGDVFVVEWESASNRVYRLDRSTNLMTGFSGLVSNIVATPPLNVYTAALETAGSCYYRIEVLP